MRGLEEKLGYRFRDEALLKLALTHPSSLEKKDNQRLEFLGDAVLEYCVSDLLYRKYPEYTEGELTARRAALVCEETLAGSGGDAFAWQTSAHGARRGANRRARKAGDPRRRDGGGARGRVPGRRHGGGAYA